VKRLKRFIAWLVLLAVLALAAFFGFSGGAEHDRTRKVVRASTGAIERRIDMRSDAIDEKLNTVDAKLDRIEAKLDRILELATPQLSDGMQPAR
jgi:hypothetical protein